MRIADIFRQYWGELIYVFSNSYSMILSMVVSVIATAFIEPADMGAIQAILLIQIYLGFLHCGVFNGLNRNIAYYKSRKEEELVQDMVNTGYTVSYVVAILGGIFALFLLVYYILIGKALVYILSSVLLFFLLIFNPLNNVVDATFRSGQQFKQLGRVNSISTTVYAILSLLPIILGYIGKIIADSLRFAISYLFKFPYRPYKQTGYGSKASLILLVRTGFPMLISGYLWTVFVSCDQTYIARNLTSKDLGLYSLAGYVMTAVLMIPTSVNALLYPKAATRYGQTNNPHSLFDFWKKSLYIYVLLLFPTCVIIYYLLPYVIAFLMPKYVEGVHAAQYSLLTCMTFITSGPAVIFGTLRKNNYYILLISLSIIAFWVVVTINANYFCSIERVAFLRFVISFVQMIFILGITYNYVKK